MEYYHTQLCLFVANEAETTVAPSRLKSFSFANGPTSRNKPPTIRSLYELDLHDQKSYISYLSKIHIIHMFNLKENFSPKITMLPPRVKYHLRKATTPGMQALF